MKFLEIARAFILVNRIFELKRGGLPLDLIGKILVIIGSGGSIGFGIWHFFVPEAWKWYSYIEPNATELVLAVQAINVFFSLSLVLFGAVNILLIYGNKSNSYSIIVMLTTTSILWITRVGSTSNYLSTRLNQPCSPIRNVISIHNCVVMLPYSISNHGIAGNKNQTPQNPNALF